MRVLLLITAAFLAGCVSPDIEPLSNQEIIKQVKLCRENGMGAALLISSWTGRVTACRP